MPASSTPEKEQVIEIISEEIMNDMETIAECSSIRALIYEALQKLDKVQAEAVKRNAKREQRIRDIRKFDGCTINNYFEQNGGSNDNE